MFSRTLLSIYAYAALYVGIAEHCPGQPSSPIVYFNTIDGFENRFVIGPTDMTSAGRYRFDANEPIQFDRLTFVRDVEFDDRRDNAPRRVRGWEYQGSDKTPNTWRIIFGKDLNTNGRSYPVYYQLTKGTEFSRWLTQSGTRRLDAPFDDEIHAILWANQVDVDRLGLEPFSEEDQSAIAVKLAWTSVLPGLNKRLEQNQSSLQTSLVRRPDRKLLIDLEVNGGVSASLLQVSLFQALGVRNDLDIRQQQLCQSRVVLESELSQQLFIYGDLDFPKVTSLISTIVRQDSPELTALRLRTNNQFFPDRCEVSSTPWQLIQCGTQYCQFWKLRFGCEQFLEDNVEKYALTLVYDIGECLASERDRGESFIILKYQSLDATEFSSLKTSVLRSGDSQHLIVVGQTIVEGLPNGYEVYDPMKTFDLMDTFNRTFRMYVSRMQGK